MTRKPKNTIRAEFESSLKEPTCFYPKLEEIKPHINYEITINPKEQGEDPYRIRDVYNHLLEYIIPLLFGSGKLYTELSHSTVRFHYHGRIMWNDNSDILSFYLKIPMLKLLCSFAINPYRDLDADVNWEVYMRKQLPYIQDYLRSHLNPTINNLPYAIIY